MMKLLYGSFTNNDSELLVDLQKKYDLLETENYDLKEQISGYEKVLNKYGYNSVEEMGEKISNNTNYWIDFVFIILITIFISYNIGVHKRKK